MNPFRVLLGSILIFLLGYIIVAPSTKITEIERLPQYEDLLVRRAASNKKSVISIDQSATPARTETSTNVDRKSEKKVIMSEAPTQNSISIERHSAVSILDNMTEEDKLLLLEKLLSEDNTLELEKLQITANILSDFDRDEEAVDYYNNYLKLHSTDAETYIMRGASYFKIGNIDEALMDLNTAVALDSNNALAYYNRGVVAVYLRDYKQGIKDFDQAILLDPMMEDAYFNRAQIKFLNDDFLGAVLDYENILEINPQNGEVHYHIALSKIAMGLFHDVCDNLDIASILNHGDAISLSQIFCVKSNMSHVEHKE